MEYLLLIFAALGLFCLIAGAVVLVLWIAMPFSVFGTKALLKRLIEEQERTNKLLISMMDARVVYSDMEHHCEGDLPTEKKNTH